MLGGMLGFLVVKEVGRRAPLFFGLDKLWVEFFKLYLTEVAYECRQLEPLF